MTAISFKCNICGKSNETGLRNGVCAKCFELHNATFPAFDEFVCEGDTVTLEIEGFTLTAKVYRDDDCDSPDKRDDGFWPSLDPKSAGYIGAKSKSTLDRRMREAKHVLQSWREDEWFYCGVAVTVSKNGIQLTGDYDHAIWGIECNYPIARRGYKTNSYLSEVASEEIGGALNAAIETIEKLTRS